jgi:hypothetical protein
MVSVTDMHDPDAYRFAHADNSRRIRFGRVAPHYILHPEEN